MSFRFLTSFGMTDGFECRVIPNKARYSPRFNRPPQIFFKKSEKNLIGCKKLFYICSVLGR